MNEILFKVIREEEANPPLFAFIWENLLLLDEAQLWKRDFPVLFLIRLMPFLGLTPLDNHDKRKTCFSLTEGLFREPDASDPYQIPADLSSWLAMVLRLPEASIAWETSRPFETRTSAYIDPLLPGPFEWDGEVKSHMCWHRCWLPRPEDKTCRQGLTIFCTKFFIMHLELTNRAISTQCIAATDGPWDQSLSCCVF
jgi:hypothetical protein